MKPHVVQILLLIVSLHFSFDHATGQTVYDLELPNVYNDAGLSFRKLFLFDSNEIAKKQIKSAHVIRTWGEPDVDGNRPFNDTCLAYIFNDHGNAIKKLVLEKSQPVATIDLPEEPDYAYGDSIQTITTTTEQYKIISKYFFWKTKERYDTAISVTTIFDESNRILEKTVTPTNLYLKSLDCFVDAPPYHYKYEYDDSGRLIYYQGIDISRYTKISYPFYGQLIQTFNRQTDTLIEQSIAIINVAHDSKSIITSTAQLVFTYQQENPKLVDQIAVIRTTGYPEVDYYNFSYEYQLGSFGQQEKKMDVPSVFVEMNRLKQILRSEDSLLIGEFTISDGFGGYSYILDALGKFRKREFSCLDVHDSDSGRYRINEQGELELISKWQRIKFTPYKFDKYAFLLTPTHVDKFKEDFQNRARICLSAKKIKFDDPRYTDEFFIAFRLMKTYLTRLE